MLNSSWKVFVLVGTVLMVLLLLQLVPSYEILGYETREVDMLGEVLNPKDDMKQGSKNHNEKHNRKGSDKYDVYKPEGVTLMEDFSDGGEGGLDHFFGMLCDSLPEDRTVNIAYYGDSFIEGDILTADLREMLQAKYGGSGPGWVEPGPNFGSFRPTVNVTWSNVSEKSVVGGGFNSQLQGPSQRYYLLSRYAAFNVNGTKKMPHAAEWQRILLFLRSQVPSSLMMGYNKGKMVVKSILPSDAVQTFEMKGQMNSAQYGFSEQPAGIQVLGLALDGCKGIALDNFSMRGVPGHSLSNMPLATMQQIARYRPYDLIIVHFGLNAVGAKSNDLEAGNYIEKMKGAIRHMQEACPGASVLVVSVSDRDQRTASGIHTIPQVEKLVSLQRKMAKELGVGFFNLFEAMGGNDSMAAMVTKGEANKDYTHLNFKGGKRLANLFYEAILAGVENYNRRVMAEGGGL